MKQVIIVGAGASGMMAAIAAAGQGASVTLLEQLNQPGKKILSTGNGHCNYTNSWMNASCYHDNPFAMDVIRRFDHERTLAFMKEIGIFPSGKNGYFYPLSGQAASVAGLLEKETKRLGVRLFTGIRVDWISRKKGRFILGATKTIVESSREKIMKNGKKKVTAKEVRTEEVKFEADAVILAGGGLAGQKLGSDGSCYAFAKGFGHHLKTPVPALTGLVCEEGWIGECSGVRIQAKVTVYIDGHEAASDSGELQITDYGISGIPTFQVSRHAARALEEGRKVWVSLLFYPEIPLEQKREFLRECRDLSGFYPDKLYRALKKLPGDDLFSEVRLQVKEAIGFDRAQVTCGGILTEEVDPETLMSEKVEDLYFCGEILDVDGICGGYNLQWAWSSGYIAGSAAALSKRSEL